ncbi:hypothetical protein GLA29479_1559 [Lysobacter antibioticus]|nr:hypothetical protein GLA29479_1559 [Lysobacter antibioticus]
MVSHRHEQGVCRGFPAACSRRAVARALPARRPPRGWHAGLRCAPHARASARRSSVASPTACAAAERENRCFHAASHSHSGRRHVPGIVELQRSAQIIRAFAKPAPCTSSASAKPERPHKTASCAVVGSVRPRCGGGPAAPPPPPYGTQGIAR